MWNLILIGKSGAGKSSAGNSILLDRKFSVSSNTCESQKMTTPVKATGNNNNCKVSVIDGLDVCSCGEKADFSNVELALSLAENDVTAFLIVIKYGERFSEESKTLIQMTKDIFGNDVIKTFGILIVTCGDNFKLDVREGDGSYQSIEEWLECQSGDLKNLYCESKRRAVLLDNRTDDCREKEEQVVKLHQVIKNMKKKYTYTDFSYKKAESFRKLLILKKISSEKKTECDSFIKEMRDAMETAKDKKDTVELEKILKSLTNYERDLTTTFGENYKLSEEMISKIKNLALDVQLKIKTKMMRLSTSNLYDEKKRKMDEERFSRVINEQLKNKDFSLNTESTATGGVTDNFEMPQELRELLKEETFLESSLKTVYKKILSYVNNNEPQKEIGKIEKETKEKLDFFENIEASKKIRSTKKEERRTRIDLDCKESVKQKEVVLLIMGGAGKGKSSTGNSIIGKSVFDKTDDTSPNMTKNYVKEYVCIGGTHYAVVEGPGLDGDGSYEHIKRLHDSVQEALKVCDLSFSALLIVLIYGERFTRQDTENIKFIKNMLGHDVIKKYGICILTHGDNFVSHNDDMKITFETWCRQQKGDIKNLFEECGYRCVLFNNRATEQRVKETQISQLLQLVSSITHKKKM